MQRALFYASHTDKFTSPKHSLLVFQVKTNKASDFGLLGSQSYNFRHLQHSCSSSANLSRGYCSNLSFLLFLLHSYFYHSKRHGLRTRPIYLAAQKICMLVVGKEANTLSTLLRIANCVKNGARKIVSSNRYKRVARYSVAHTYF